jgi:Domain of unknown function (DUF4337)
MDAVEEHAQETIHHHGGSNRRVAVLIAALAAALALAEMAERQEQNAYLTHHISLSDDFAFYQAKNARAAISAVEASILGNLPNAAEPAVQAAIAKAKGSEARLRDEPGGDGMKLLMERAATEQESRDHAFHRYHRFELVSGALQIAIVVASVAVVTSMPALAFAAGVIGAAAAGLGIYIAAG